MRTYFTSTIKINFLDDKKIGETSKSPFGINKDKKEETKEKSPEDKSIFKLKIY